MTYDDYIESSNFEIDELDDIEEQLDIETEPERKKTKWERYKLAKIRSI